MKKILLALMLGLCSIVFIGCDSFHTGGEMDQKLQSIVGTYWSGGSGSFSSVSFSGSDCRLVYNDPRLEARNCTYTFNRQSQQVVVKYTLYYIPYGETSFQKEGSRTVQGGIHYQNGGYKLDLYGTNGGSTFYMY